MTYDVVVVGGGAGGVAAAVGARETGARVLLVERYGMLGGAATISSVLTYCGFFTQADPPEQVVEGVGERVLQGLRDIGRYDETSSKVSGNRFVLLDPEAVKLALDRLVTKVGVDVAMHRQVISADQLGDRVHSVTLAGDNGNQTVSAGAFVDATGNTNLAFMAGADTEQPGPDEPYQASTMMMRLGGIGPDVDVSQTAVRSAVLAGRTKASMTLPRETGVTARLPGSQDVIAILADVQFDTFDTAELTRAEMTGRELAWAYTDVLRRHLPGAERVYLVSTGPKIGIREGRRLAGHDRVTRDDVVAARKPPDSIARCGWPIEEHPEPGRSVYESVGGRGWYGIPLGALISRSHNNLFAAGRTVSCDRTAFSSLRVMGTAFATGHAAGVAAALCASGTGHDAALTQKTLVKQNALL